MERNGSRLMMKIEESGVKMLPRPAPTSCGKDLQMPSPMGLVVLVTSVSWAEAGTTMKATTAATKSSKAATIARCFADILHTPYVRPFGRWGAERDSGAPGGRARAPTA